ncbi:hypothetical protein CP083_06120, partial [Candidatus Bathyarchaeota archaeon B24-2]
WSRRTGFKSPRRPSIISLFIPIKVVFHVNESGLKLMEFKSQKAYKVELHTLIISLRDEPLEPAMAPCSTLE